MGPVSTPLRRTIAVSPHGDIDITTAPLLRRQLTDALNTAGTGLVICDLDDVSFMDCRGFSTLVFAHHLAEERGGRFGVAAAHGIVRRAFDLLQMQRVVADYETVEAATASAAG